MRVCIAAENASTRFGGEAILPVHYFRLLRSRGVEAWLVVHERSRAEAATLFPGDMDRIRFVPDLLIHRLLFRMSRFLPRRLSEATVGLLIQLITQACQRTVVRRLVAAEKIDVVHQPIPVAPRFPSLMFGLGAPVVIGPLNGGMEYPPAFRRAESWMSRAGIAAARLGTNLGNTLLPGRKRAAAVLVANERTRRALPRGIRGRVILMPENGVDAGVWQTHSQSGGETKQEVRKGTKRGTKKGSAQKGSAQSGGIRLDNRSGSGRAASSSPPRFVFIGRLVDWKAVDIAIRAMERVPGAELEIIGDGPMRAEWMSLAADPGLGGRVRFSGWLAQAACAERLQSALALVLPSLYECGGAVVLEAMAMGKPVVATGWGGPADYLDASSGMLVAPDDYPSMVAGFADAMQALMDLPVLARSLGEAGRERALRDFDWERRIERMISIYESVMRPAPQPAAVADDLAAAVARNRA